MRKKTILRSGFALILCCAMVSLSVVGVSAAKTDDLRAQLTELQTQGSEIKSQLQSIERDYNANSDEIVDLIGKKNAIDQEIGLLHQQAANINEQIQAYGQLIANTQEELDTAKEVQRELCAKHAVRVRAMEEEGTLSYWHVIFESASFTDLLDRLTMVDEIAASDQKRLDELKAAADLVQETQDNLTSEKDGLESSRKALESTETELNEKRAESDEVLRELIKKGEEFEALLEQTKAEQDRLLAQIARKQYELQMAEYEQKLIELAKQGQNPPCEDTWLTPVDGYTITSAYGNREAPTAGASSNHKGVDMACPANTPIVASRDGTVTTATYSSACGYYVTISHGDGFSSTYMHMTSYCVSSGQTVTKGQTIGYVGSTGISTGNHLHFGVSYGGSNVNPMAYIG